ncbi:MAG: hypothetical protein KJ893_08055 [Candidatus Omnitrophica bacterium]|nr:hypothetical protein [Candidatus Omnitrophota bacterium]MBU4477926.1 hypothetical protein [Candidatus Omnitrophota bacterium]MCG2703846.1 hypothetical protein [Candidatus Omnitrophota bacterium]
MDGLINLIIYVIIIAAWVIRNIKKQGKWEAEIPRVPDHIPPSPAPEQKPEKQEPLREGDFADESQARVKQDSSAISDDELKEYFLITSEKETLYLKCKIEEGIIWSIILGLPRSKLRFNWKNSPIRR